MLKFSDMLEAQDKYRAALPPMVDRETVIRLIFQAIDETMEVCQGNGMVDALAEVRSRLGSAVEARK